MDINVTEQIVRTTTVKLDGRIDAFNVGGLRAQFSRLIDEGATEFIVDLSDVTFLDSAGMAALVSLLKQARSNGGDVSLVWPKLEAAQRILRLTKFDRVFTMLEQSAATNNG
jgi:anti-anti-sigma factor